MELKIKDLNKSYDDKEVLKDINFTFKDNCIYGLIGRNGAGKTTFMNAIDSVIKVNSGEFLLDDKELDTNEIGFVVSTPLVPEFLTGREFVQFYIDVHKDKIENLKDIHLTILTKRNTILYNSMYRKIGGYYEEIY